MVCAAAVGAAAAAAAGEAVGAVSSTTEACLDQQRYRAQLVVEQQQRAPGGLRWRHRSKVGRRKRFPNALGNLLRLITLLKREPPPLMVGGAGW